MKADAAATTMETNCRHVAPNDNRFQARMRFHQSWYRRHVLGLPPGPNPSAGNTLYGNILRDVDAKAGCNFLTPTIATWIETRLQADAESVNSTRLRGNMLSSQPMCFNLFGPLACDLDMATQLVRVLPGVPSDLTVTAVRCEFAPDPTRHLRDKTAFDAWIEYALPNGAKGFVGIETKLTEPFSPQEYAFDARYSRWQTFPDWWWRPDAEKDFPDTQINQLWRNHLLAFAMLHQPEPVYAQGFCAVLHHDLDPSCVRAIGVYRSHLLPESDTTLLQWTLSNVVNRWAMQLAGTAEASWLEAFRLRYLDLDASGEAWKRFQEET